FGARSHADYRAQPHDASSTVQGPGARGPPLRVAYSSASIHRAARHGRGHVRLQPDHRAAAPRPLRVRWRPRPLWRNVRGARRWWVDRRTGGGGAGAHQPGDADRIGGPIIGWISQQWGARAGLFVGGTLSLLAAGAAAWSVRRQRLRVEPSDEPDDVVMLSGYEPELEEATA